MTAVCPLNFNLARAAGFAEAQVVRRFNCFFATDQSAGAGCDLNN